MEMEQQTDAVRGEFYLNLVDDKVHCRMFLPGDTNFQPDFIADDEHKARFPQEWEAFCNDQEQHAGETSLEAVTWIDPAIIPTLKHNNLHSIEQLAQIPDGNLGPAQLGLDRLRTKARAHVEQVRKAAAYDEQDDNGDSLLNQVNEIVFGKGAPPQKIKALKELLE